MSEHRQRDGAGGPADRPPLADPSALADLLYQAAPMGLCLLDCQLRFVRINERMARRHQLPVSAHLGRSLRELLPQRADQAEALLEQILTSGRPVCDVEVSDTGDADPGAEGIWREHWSPLKDASGAVVGIQVVAEDITGQRRAVAEREHLVAALDRQSRELRQTLDTAAVGLTRIDRQLRYVTANRAYADIAGLPLERIVGHTMQEVIGETGVARLRPHIDRVLSGEPVEYETELLWSQSGPRWIHVRYTPWRAAGGAVEGWVASVEDISARKQAEQASTARESLFQTLADTMPQMVWSTRPDGSADYYNARWYEFTGVPPGSTDGDAWSAIFHPDDQASARAHWQASVASGQPYEIEYRLRHRDGSYRWVLGRALPLKDGSGRIVRWVGTCTDIDEARRLAEEHRLAEARLRLATESARIATWEIDYAAGVGYWTPQAARLWGIQPGVVSVNEWVESLHADDRERAAAAWQRAVDHDAPYEIEFRSRVPAEDGSERWFLSRGIVERDASGAPRRALGVFVDISEQKRFEAALKDREEALRRADRQKDIFLATLSHELRNPLAPIRTAAKLLGNAQLDAQRLEWARGVIQRQVAHMASLLDDLLDIARITQGKVILSRERVLLSAVVDEAVEATRPLMQRKEHRLNLAVAREDVIVDADPVRLAQVISNLLTNAAKYTDHGGSIELATRVSDGHVCIEVKDSGIGLAPEVIPTLFEMFSQVQGEKDRAEGGLGVGLALVKALVDLHGGEVSASSEGPGKGSVFTVRLPRIDGQAASAEAAAQTPVPMLRRKVLVVDDNRDGADGLAMFLEFAGHEIQVAYEARSALSLAPSFRPDIAVLDIGMPGMDGYALARAWRTHAWGRDTTLIALTGWGQDEDRRRAREAGFDHHLTKPVDPMGLAALLARTPAVA